MVKTSKYDLSSFRYQATKSWSELDPNFKSYLHLTILRNVFSQVLEPNAYVPFV